MSRYDPNRAFLRGVAAVGVVVGFLMSTFGATSAAADPATLTSVRAVVEYLNANGLDCTGLKAVGTDKYGGKYGRCNTSDGPVTVRAYKSVKASKQARHSLRHVWNQPHCSGKYRKQQLHILIYGTWILDTRSTVTKDTVIEILDLQQDWKHNKGSMRLTCG